MTEETTEETTGETTGETTEEMTGETTGETTEEMTEETTAAMPGETKLIPTFLLQVLEPTEIEVDPPAATAGGLGVR
jgi:hypothetical protein